jgi:glycosyltransferase involved in cell wall biosynthesis
VFVNWSEAEGFGLPVIEALACGARVIVPPDNPTLQEVGCGQVIVAERATPASLMQALARIARSGAQKQGMANLTAFDWDGCCRRFEEELWSERTSDSLRRAA